MQGKLVLALAVIGIIVIIGPADGCKLCGMHWCSCGAQRPLVPSFPRSWQIERPLLPPPPTERVIEHQSIAQLCRICGGYNRGSNGGCNCGCNGGYNREHTYCPRNEGGHSRGYYCRCSPRGNRLRYDDYC